MRTGPRFLLPLLGALAVFAHAAIAQAYVYWTTGTDVGRANLDGNGINGALLGGAGTADGVVTDGTYIYWGDGDSIERADLDGSHAQPLITTDTSPEPDAIATDGTYLYWVTGGTNIYRASLDGTGVVNLVPSAGTALEALTIADGNIYYPSAGAIHEVSASGGTPRTFITLSGIEGQPPPSVFGITNANGGLYWTEFTLASGGGGFGDIGSATLNNSPSANETFIDTPIEPGEIATDGTYLYWSDVGVSPTVISRAAIDAPASPETDFITVPGGADGIAVDAAVDPTTTSVTCTATTALVGKPSSCTATVSDTASTAVATGTVSFTGGASIFFSGNPCELTPVSGGASCTVSADLTAAGTQPITATYAGDPIHHSSSATVTLCAGAAAQCGGTPPPPPKTKPACVVPKLKGKTLAKARKLLSKARCKLGKVTKPKHGQKLVVASTKPRAGTKLANGAKVTLVLVHVPRRKR
jgi:Bacterial Ig-like domain (group 3)/PASTA domain